MTAPGEFAGKVAIVTGGGRRIGRAICLRLAESGASVVVNAKTGLAGALAVAREIEAMGCSALPILTDVTDPVAVKRMVDATIERFGRIDILVNNAVLRGKNPPASCCRSSAARPRRWCSASFSNRCWS